MSTTLHYINIEYHFPFIVHSEFVISFCSSLQLVLLWLSSFFLLYFVNKLCHVTVHSLIQITLQTAQHRSLWDPAGNLPPLWKMAVYLHFISYLLINYGKSCRTFPFNPCHLSFCQSFDQGPSQRLFGNPDSLQAESLLPMCFLTLPVTSKRFGRQDFPQQRTSWFFMGVSHICMDMF